MDKEKIKYIKDARELKISLITPGRIHILFLVVLIIIFFTIMLLPLLLASSKPPISTLVETKYEIESFYSEINSTELDEKENSLKNNTDTLNVSKKVSINTYSPEFLELYSDEVSDQLNFQSVLKNLEQNLLDLDREYITYNDTFITIPSDSEEYFRLLNQILSNEFGIHSFESQILIPVSEDEISVNLSTKQYTSYAISRRLKLDAENIFEVELCLGGKTMYIYSTTKYPYDTIFYITDIVNNVINKNVYKLFGGSTAGIFEYDTLKFIGPSGLVEETSGAYSKFCVKDPNTCLYAFKGVQDDEDGYISTMIKTICKDLGIEGENSLVYKSFANWIFRPATFYQFIYGNSHVNCYSFKNEIDSSYTVFAVVETGADFTEMSRYLDTLALEIF